MILEVRTYRLKPGCAQDYLRVFREQSLPLLEQFGIRVVGGGISLVGDDAYLIREFDSLEERERQEAAFYGSDEWIKGPRERVMSFIDSYHTVVLPGDAGAQLLSGQ